MNQTRLKSIPAWKDIASREVSQKDILDSQNGVFSLNGAELRHLQTRGHLPGSIGDAQDPGSTQSSNAYASNPDHKDSDAHRGPFPMRDSEGNIVEPGTKDFPMP